MYYKKTNKKNSVMWMLLLLTVIIIISGCEKKVVKTKDNITSITGSEQEKTNYDMNFLGVVKEVNDISKTITLYSVDEDKDITLFYTGGTDVKDQYEQIISMGQIDLGEMVDAYYVDAKSKLVKLQISNTAWEYKSVDKLKIDKSNKVMEIVEQKYQYTEKIVVASEDELISLIDLNDRDELTVKGVEGKIYSVMVTKGHGYIRLTNYADFIGGTIEVGYGIIVPVMEDMLIVAREGSYKITMENGELVGSRNVKVSKNREITLDMGDFRIEKERVGLVDFIVSPEGADLYINGALVDYTKPLELNYGEHDVIVVLAGYQDFVGILNVASPYQAININLAEAIAEVVKEDETDQDSPNNQDDESGGTDITQDDTDTTKPSTGTTKIDNSHTITVQAPEGAKVYLNGTLKGTAPLTFTKEIGTHIITFSKSGYETKSYTIEVVDDLENVSFSFPNMTKAQSE